MFYNIRIDSVKYIRVNHKNMLIFNIFELYEWQFHMIKVTQGKNED